MVRIGVFGGRDKRKRVSVSLEATRFFIDILILDIKVRLPS